MEKSETNRITGLTAIKLVQELRAGKAQAFFVGPATVSFYTRGYNFNISYISLCHIHTYICTQMTHVND